jgi:hypothetical protein
VELRDFWHDFAPEKRFNPEEPDPEEEEGAEEHSAAAGGALGGSGEALPGEALDEAGGEETEEVEEGRVVEEGGQGAEESEG